MRLGTQANRAGCPDCLGSLPILGGESEPNGGCGCLGTSTNVELAQNCRNVMRRRLLRHEQACCNLAVAQSLRDERQHFELTSRQVRGVSARARPRSARQAARAARTQPPGNDRRSRCGTHRLELVERLSKGAVVVRVAEGESRVVWTAELTPALGGALPIACELHRIRLHRRLDRLL